jgi:UDP-N-acetyl-D-mannosaminuronic acid dehydrogenase
MFHRFQLRNIKGQQLEKVCVVGLGYIGLPTASLLATKGFKVAGVDVNATVVDTINQGKIHIHEPDLDILVKSAVQSGNLKASVSPVEADVFILAVPTPIQPDHSPDLSFVQASARSVAPFLRPGNLLILESTSPVGTTEWIADFLRTARPDLEVPVFESKNSTASRSVSSPKVSANKIFIAHCPERVLPGNILKELVKNDRIVGGVDGPSAERARDFYAQFVGGEILPTDVRTAELSKLTENAFRDVNIAYANELSLICNKIQVDVWELISLANRHPRVNILSPGPGVGGHCIAVDPWFIVDAAPAEARLIRTAREVNDSKPGFVIDQVKAELTGAGSKTVACLGLSFKPDIDDLRESPSIEIVKHLAVDRSLTVYVVEPHISALPSDLREIPNIRLVPLETALESTSVLALLVPHKLFRKIPATVFAGKRVVDPCGVVSAAKRLN